MGKGELEDMLHQPKNDDVLFTFFGMSKLIPQRSLSVEVRRRLAVKRKALRLHGSGDMEVLVRDAGDERYPYPDENEKDKVRARRWCVYRFEGCHHDGLHLLMKRCFAFLDSNAWDCAERMDDASPHKNPRRTEEDKNRKQELDEAREQAWEYGKHFPKITVLGWRNGSYCLMRMLSKSVRRAMNGSTDLTST